MTIFSITAISRKNDPDKQRAHRDRGVEQRRVEAVGGLDDQRADALRRADPFADDGADHRHRRGDLQRREEIRQRGVDAQLEEDLAAAGREHAHQLHRLRVDRLEAATHVDQRREEADQRRDHDLGRHAVAHHQHEDRRLGDDRDRVEHHRHRKEDLLQPAVVHEHRRERIAASVAEQEAAQRLDRRRASGCRAARRACSTASAATARGDGAMNGLTSNPTTTRPPQRQQADDAERRQQAAAPALAASARHASALLGIEIRRAGGSGADPGSFARHSHQQVTSSGAGRPPAPRTARSRGSPACARRAARPARSRARGPGWPPASARAGRERPPRRCCA